jgi:hypothetical protein
MGYLNTATVSVIADNNDSEDVFCFDLGDLDGLDGNFISLAVQREPANYGSKTRCGKIIRRFNHRTNELAERYLSRIYRLLSEECYPANKQVRFLNGGRLIPTRNGMSVAYEFEIGSYDSGDFVQEFTLSVPVLWR